MDTCTLGGLSLLYQKPPLKLLVVYQIPFVFALSVVVAAIVGGSTVNVGATVHFDHSGIL